MSLRYSPHSYFSSRLAHTHPGARSMRLYTLLLSLYALSGIARKTVATLLRPSCTAAIHAQRRNAQRRFSYFTFRYTLFMNFTLCISRSIAVLSSCAPRSKKGLGLNGRGRLRRARVGWAHACASIIFLACA